jgi:HEAT repeat protein
MVSFCPSCWREIDAGTAVCPACRADLALEDARPFVEKVRRALLHPEPETAIRAAWILGELREKAAAPELMRALETTQDGYLAEAAAESLGKIGDPGALPVLERAAERGSLRTQLAAREALERIRGGGEASGSKRPREAGSAGPRRRGQR